MRPAPPPANDDAAEARPRRVPWFRREPIDLGDVLVQTIAVLLGVLIALAIDRWHEQATQQRDVASAVESIRAEIGRNRDAALAHRDHLQAMAGRMEQLHSGEAQPAPCMGQPGWAGVQLPMLMDTAYEVAVATGALSNMPYELASAVGTAYGAQRYIQGMYDTAGKMLLAERPADVRMCTNVAREMAAGSAGLAERYQALLDALPPSR
jgi:hypothetical protein